MKVDEGGVYKSYEAVDGKPDPKMWKVKLYDSEVKEVIGAWLDNELEKKQYSGMDKFAKEDIEIQNLINQEGIKG